MSIIFRWLAHNKFNKKINLDNIDKSSDNEEIYYKERWINKNGLEQRLIVSYSPKYAAYQRRVRNRQVEMAQKIISNPTEMSRTRPQLIIAVLFTH